MTRFRKSSTALLAVMLACQATSANAVCVTEPEARSVALFLAPDMIRALANTCKPLLPANAYLTRSSGVLVQRYHAASSAAWPGVQALLGRIPEVKMFRSLNEEGARGMIGALLEDKALGKIKPADCAMADAMLAPLDPLPPENMASFLVALGRLGEAAGRQSSAKGANNKTPAKPSFFCGAAPDPAKASMTIPPR